MTRSVPLLVVGWAGADWPRLHPLIDAGELPALAGIVEGGVSGALSALEPLNPAALWTTLATGRRATEHGVLGDAEIALDTGEVRPATAGSWRQPAVWQTLATGGRRCHVVGWPGTHPGAALPHGGVLATDSYPRPTAPPEAAGVAAWPLLRGAVTAENPEIVAALVELRVSPAEIDPELLAEFVPRWREVDHALDPRLRGLALALAETLSVHNAATFLLEVAPPDALFVHYGLLERLAPLFLPCSGDGLPEVAARHRELYGGVLTAACRWLDGFLARLQTLAGPRATTAVVSPAGYHAPAAGLPLRAETFPPTAALPGWQRAAGMFAAAGVESGLRRDELVHGLSVLDLAPVCGRLLGLPSTGSENPSTERLAAELFHGSVPLPVAKFSASGVQGVSTDAAALSPGESQAFRAQFQATGEWPTVPTAKRVQRERDLALARAWTQAGQDAFALPVLERWHGGQPEDPAVAFALTLCYLHLGRLKPARAAAETVFDHQWDTPQAELLRGHFAYCEGRYEAAFDCFQTAGAAGGDRLAGWENQLGLALLKLGRFAEADEAFGRSLARQPDDAHAWLGRGHARLRLGDYAGAAEASRTAIGLRYDHPLAHFNVGLALARLGDGPEAVHHLETVGRLLGASEGGSGLAKHAQRVLKVLRRQWADAPPPSDARDATLLRLGTE